jgi:hypothetical protein
MSHPRSTVAGIQWNTLFPWLILVRAARVALMVRVILLALAGVALTQVGWHLIDRLLGDYGDVPFLNQLTDMTLKERPAALTINNYETLSVHVDAYGGPLLTGWYWPALPIMNLLQAEGWQARLAYLLAGAWSIGVWALFGGAIARIAALYLTRGETIGPVAALRSAFVKWPSTAGAPAGALLGMLLIALPLMFAGLLMRLDLLALFAGLLWIVLLIGGLALAVLAIGLLLGWPLMWATVAVERTDGFDGISRGYAYVYQRPLHAAFYVAVAGALGLLAHWVLGVFVQASADATYWAVSAGAGEQRVTALLEPRVVPPLAPAAPPFGRTLRELDADDSDSAVDEQAIASRGRLEAISGKLMRFWQTSWFWLTKVFPMAYLWPAATGIYLLLRRQIDAADLGDVTFDEGDPQRGLAPLVNDPVTGVPHVDPAATAAPHPPAPPAP